MSDEKVVHLDSKKRFNKKALEDIIQELQALKEADPALLDHFMISYGVSRKNGKTSGKGGVAFKSVHFNMDFGALGFLHSVLEEISAQNLYEVGGLQHADEFPDDFPPLNSPDDSKTS